MEALPIDEVIPEVLSGLRVHGSVVLQAPAGAGKTTRVPPAILDSGLVPRGQVLVLEPRRMAARAAARRIAFERGSKVPGEVGYRVRFDDATTRDTRLITMTEGILIRQLQDDPLLERVAAVVFDEFHERHLDTDLSLAMVRRVQELRPELKIVVMSATLSPEPISKYLHDAPIVRSLGRMFPVEIGYLKRADRNPWPDQVAQAAERMLEKTDGNILAFLPGVGEIKKAERILSSNLPRADVDVLTLFGDMAPEDQDRVIAPSHRRKIVLATNVAESSVTVDGVTGVIDSGVARVLRYDPEIGLDRLEIEPISQASADQRAGRAGRQSPGICWRLWEEASQRHRPEMETAEIRRVDLSGAILNLLCWGERDWDTFPWYETPSRETLERAEGLLRRLGAIDSSRHVTSLGKTMVRFPVAPRLARLLVSAAERGVAERGVWLASLLSERDPFRSSQHGAGSSTARGPSKISAQRSGPMTTSLRSRSDVVDRLSAIESFLAGHREGLAGQLNHGSLSSIERAAEQLGRLVERELLAHPSNRTNERLSSAQSDERVMRALLDAYPDRLAKRRDLGANKGVMVSGRGVRLAPSSGVLDAELFLAIDVDGGASEALVRQASEVQRDWLDEDQLVERVDCFWHPTRQEIVARRRLLWDDLVIEERPEELPGDEAQANLLADMAKKSWQGWTPRNNAELNQWLARAHCLKAWRPEVDFPQFDDSRLKELLVELSWGKKSIGELNSIDWVSAFENRLTYAQRQMMESEVPERLTVPSGRKLKLEYEIGRPPVLAIKIQDAFGWSETPTLAAGRVKVLLHLLAPNQRPQQVTDDLASFWATTYTVCRKELRGRYPKHAWPEDPRQLLKE